jgi:alkylhydroperoxidase/carboxymuconolactone decarboxylase family protein YurZ
MTEKSWSELLAEHSEELAALSEADGAFLEADSALPAWVKYLMAMQLDAIANHPRGVRWYGRRARELGARKAQVVEAIKLLRVFGGRPAMVTGAEALRDDD